MQTLSQEHQGELFKLGDTLIMSIFPIVSILAIQSLHPLIIAGSSLLVGGILAGISSVYFHGLKEIKAFVSWKYFPLSLLVISISFCFWFLGFAYTTANNAVILQKAEILFTFIFWGLILKREKYSKFAYLGAALILIGILVTLFKNFQQFYFGDLIILLAFISLPIGTFLAKEARTFVSSNTVISVRYGFAGILLLSIGLFLDQDISQTNWIESLPFILYNGIFAFWLTKILWTESIHRIPITKALLIGGITPIFTMIWSYFIFKEIPSMYQIAGFLIILSGVWFVVKKDFLK